MKLYHFQKCCRGLLHCEKDFTPGKYAAGDTALKVDLKSFQKILAWLAKQVLKTSSEHGCSLCSSSRTGASHTLGTHAPRLAYSPCLPSPAEQARPVSRQSVVAGPEPGLAWRWPVSPSPPDQARPGAAAYRPSASCVTTCVVVCGCGAAFPSFGQRGGARNAPPCPAWPCLAQLRPAWTS